MAKKPISVQLYSVRDALNEDPWGTLEKIAGYGYVGVEPFNVIGGDVEEMARRINDLGLKVNAVQIGAPVGDDANRLMDEAAALGTTHLVHPYHDRADWTSTDGIKKVADMLQQGVDNAAQRGMTVGYHNHDFELAVIDGKPGLLYLLDLVPDLKYTVDTYWVTVGGQNAVEIVSTLGDKANILHIKDGPLDKDQAMTAVGAGKMDFAPIIEAAPAAEWLVVEIDRCDTDMMAAVEQSINYLVAQDLGEARK